MGRRRDWFEEPDEGGTWLDQLTGEIPQIDEHMPPPDPRAGGGWGRPAPGGRGPGGPGPAHPGGPGAGSGAPPGWVPRSGWERGGWEQGPPGGPPPPPPPPPPYAQGPSLFEEPPFEQDPGPGAEAPQAGRVEM